MTPDQSLLELVRDHRARRDRPCSRLSATPPRASCRNTSSRASATSCQVSSQKSQPQNHMSNWLKSPAKTEMTPGSEPNTSHTVTSPERPDEMRTMRDTSWPSQRAYVGGSTTGASMTTSYSRSTYSMRPCATAPTGRNRSPESQVGWSPMLWERITSRTPSKTGRAYSFTVGRIGLESPPLRPMIQRPPQWRLVEGSVPRTGRPHDGIDHVPLGDRLPDTVEFLIAQQMAGIEEAFMQPGLWGSGGVKSQTRPLAQGCFADRVAPTER
jgi:hypothetical protein